MEAAIKQCSVWIDIDRSRKSSLSSDCSFATVLFFSSASLLKIELYQRPARNSAGDPRQVLLLCSHSGLQLEEAEMKLNKMILTGFLLCAVGGAQAKDKPAYEKGVLGQMASTSCGYAEKDGKSLTGELIGTDSQHKQTQEVLCQDYILQTDRIVNRTRPKHQKHPVLL